MSFQIVFMPLHWSTPTSGAAASIIEAETPWQPQHIPSPVPYTSDPWILQTLRSYMTYKDIASIMVATTALSEFGESALKLERRCRIEWLYPRPSGPPPPGPPLSPFERARFMLNL